jgi:PleD family two-component response regulator
MDWGEHEGLTITASFGVTDLQRAASPDGQSLVESADQALYEAKRAGRDRVVIAPGPMERSGLKKPA